KPAIALDLLDQAKAWGLRWACVTCDADYGDNPNFLGGLEKRRQRYIVAVRCDFAVSMSRRGGPAQRADAVIEALPARSWRTGAWREGSRGWLRGPFVAVRAWRGSTSGRRRAGWLIGERTAEGKLKYYWSNLREKVSLERLVEYAHRRHWVERYHQEAKGLLGWDQYQGRVWAGFHPPGVKRVVGVQFLGWGGGASGRAVWIGGGRADGDGIGPRARIGGGPRSRRSTGRSAIGSASKRPKNGWAVSS